MTSELEELSAVAAELATVAPAEGDLAARAERLHQRLAHGRFHVSVLGAFKSGKSTLVNALLGEEVVPTGVLPLTAVSTEVSHGAHGAVVVHADGTRCEIPLARLTEYVTEQGNPESSRQVAHVEVTVPAPLLGLGLVLVDTPGFGSIYRQNDEEAYRALRETDGAIVVLSSETPMSQQERELVASLAQRESPTFFLLNKVDRVTPAERDHIARFVAEVLEVELGRLAPLWCVSARAALDCRRTGDDVAARPEAGQYAEFERDFVAWLDRDLVAARLAAARGELGRLGRSINEQISVEAVLLDLGAEQAADIVAAFEAAVRAQQQVLADGSALLARDVRRLVDETGVRLGEFARMAPRRSRGLLAATAAAAPLHEVERKLGQLVEAVVEEEFEAFRSGEQAALEEAWSTVAGRLRSRTEVSVNELRATAASLLDLPLDQVVIPPLEDERDQFRYVFVHVEPLAEELVRALSHFLPPSARRRRALRRAEARLTAECERHAGRLRWDAAQRLEGVGRRFEEGMRQHVEATVSAIKQAAVRAEELRRSSEAERESYVRNVARTRAAARRAVQLGGAAPSGDEAPPTCCGGPAP